MMKEKRLELNKRLLALILCVAVFAGIFSGGSGEKLANAAYTPYTITLVQAKKLAIAKSAAIEKIELQIEAKQAALSSAIKSIAVKKHNMETFRWSPLLSFKFPTKPDLVEAYEFQFKPVKIIYEIDKLNHKLVDTKLAEYEKVVNLYVDIVVYERRIAFNEGRVEILESAIAKSKVKLLAGDAKQADIDTMEKSLDKLKQSITADMRALVSAKKKMSNLIKLDVTSRYAFQDPFLQSDLSRDLLEDLIQYTLDRDDAYYDLCVDETTGRLSVETNFNLLRNHYSSKYMNLISPYIKAVLRGDEIDTKAFNKNYKQFVNTVNEKWDGYRRIIFFKIPKEWFQGAIDGDRFIEDDPYGAYTAVMDYRDAVKARQQGEEDLIAQVTEAFDNYVSVRNGYLSYEEQVAQAEEDLEKARILNRAGDLTYDEFKATSDNLEELQNSLMETMKQYTQTLISLDRLTCGGVSAYLGDLTGDMTANGGGESYVDPVYTDIAHYYIQPIVQSQQFKLGVSFPEEFDIPVTDFELWIDGVQVGTRKPVDQEIRHLSFDLNNVNRAFIRFYNEEEFIDDVDIDPMAYSGELKLVKEYKVRTNNEIGEYVLSYSEVRNHYTLTFTMNSNEEIGFYKIKDASGAYLLSDKPREISEPMVYLNTINASMSALEFEFFDKSGEKLYDAYADVTLMKLYKKDEE